MNEYRDTMTLDEALQDVWSVLTMGAQDRKHPAHTPTLSTLDAQGLPDCRTMVLRSVQDYTLRFHTDVRATKWQQISRAAQGCVHTYLPSLKLQLRLKGALILHQNDALSHQAWQTSQPTSRQGYRIAPSPGGPIEEPGSWALIEESAARSNFGVMLFEATEVQWLYLLSSGHRRAHFQRVESTWTGRWLVP